MEHAVGRPIEEVFPMGGYTLDPVDGGTQVRGCGPA